jgi:hypothetical protein
VAHISRAAFQSSRYDVLNLIAKHRFDIHPCRVFLREGCRRSSHFNVALLNLLLIKEPVSRQSIPATRLSRSCLPTVVPDLSMTTDTSQVADWQRRIAPCPLWTRLSGFMSAVAGYR